MQPMKPLDKLQIKSSVRLEVTSWWPSANRLLPLICPPPFPWATKSGSFSFCFALKAHFKQLSHTFDLTHAYLFLNYAKKILRLSSLDVCQKFPNNFSNNHYCVDHLFSDSGSWQMSLNHFELEPKFLISSKWACFHFQILQVKPEPPHKWLKKKILHLLLCRFTQPA